MEVVEHRAPVSMVENRPANHWPRQHAVALPNLSLTSHARVTNSIFEQATCRGNADLV
jgi:hypothetical protein